MTSGRDGEPEEATTINYPSPGAETLDAGPFYHTGGRDDTQEHNEAQDHHEQQEQTGQHDPNQVHPADGDPSQIPGHEASSPQHHMSRPPNLEELQLAAQLGQGLAGTSMMPATDPNMSVEDPNMRNIMPHPEADQQQTPSYVQDTPTSEHMVQHAIQVPVGPPLPPQYSISDGIPPRKRSKVSRACDECRRKKIKCDAQSDTGEAPCSSCARSSIRCLFSRVPQKRGPSKGYIKELADRIHSIENKLESEGSLTQDDIDRLFAPGSQRTYNALVPSEDSGRKRPFSSVSTADFSTPAPVRQAPWGSEPRPILPAPASSDGFPTPGFSGNNSLAPQPSAVKPDDTPSKPPVASMDSHMTDADDVSEIDETALHDYLSHVQAVYPILPSSKLRVQSLLSQCPVPVRTAFTAALLAVGQSSGDTKNASSLLHEWESSETSRSRAADIVHAQTLLLLIIDADWRSSSQLPFLLARAVALANTMKLWRFTPIESASEPDSDDQLCVRIWWSLVLMDRWHAAGMGKPSQIPDSSVVAPAGLENTVGEVCFYLIRLSKLLNRISFIITTLQPGTSTTEPPMAAILTDYIENYREDLPGHIEAASYPLVHLAYWHCKLLVTLLTPGASPTETLWPTTELANLLLANSQLRSPYINHFVSLIAMSLTKLSKSESSREGSVRLMKEIIDKPNGGPWDSVRDSLTEQLRPTSSVEATASQGLQHLADLATAHEGIAPGPDDLAFGPTLASGYLDVA